MSPANSSSPPPPWAPAIGEEVVVTLRGLSSSR